jgi:hypothetical protein
MSFILGPVTATVLASRPQGHDMAYLQAADNIAERRLQDVSATWHGCTHWAGTVVWRLTLWPGVQIAALVQVALSCWQ